MVEVVWRKGALDHLSKHCSHIKKDSPSSAKKVRDAILDMAEALKKHPEINPLGKFRRNNKGDIRAFEKFSLRMAYQVAKSEIRIIRVRHIKRNPLEY